MVKKRTEHQIFDRGTVNRDRDLQQVVLPHVRLFRDASGAYFVFMEYNAKPRRTLALEELLESEDITRMN